ncbi:TonB-dependent receptor [Sphingomonas lutea]|uniref:TonB-dependent receptor n=1 Tax=Sphingomonas lutea TaxID=1045317 RepID=A0A7G9SJ82_9SPHN|nr:TonB-dependent receptor [Sphingomonas lutea]QNN67907.1 TonB-dependent receptor [Sphingomonas lutea]
MSTKHNVPKARTIGAEADFAWQVSARLSARLALGLLDTKVLVGAGESASLQGKQFDRSPPYSATAAVDWRVTDRLRLSGQLRHRGAYFSDPSNSRERRVNRATNVDVRAEYDLAGVKMFAQVRNLFDSLILLRLDSASSGEAEDPRTVSIGIGRTF